MNRAHAYRLCPEHFFESTATSEQIEEMLEKWRLDDSSPRDALQIFSREFAYKRITGADSSTLQLWTEGLKSCFGLVVFVPRSFLGLAHVSGFSTGENYIDTKLQTQVIPLINEALKTGSKVTVLLTHGYKRDEPEVSVGAFILHKLQTWIHEQAALGKTIKLFTPHHFNCMAPTDSLQYSGGVYLRWSPDKSDELLIITTLHKLAVNFKAWDNSNYAYSFSIFDQLVVHPGALSPNCGILSATITGNLPPLNMTNIIASDLLINKAWSLDLNNVKTGDNLLARRRIAANIVLKTILDSGRIVKVPGSSYYTITMSHEEALILHVVQKQHRDRLLL